MQQLRGALDDPAPRDADGLVAEADAEQRQLPLGAARGSPSTLDPARSGVPGPGLTSTPSTSSSSSRSTSSLRRTDAPRRRAGPGTARGCRRSCRSCRSRGPASGRCRGSPAPSALPRSAPSEQPDRLATVSCRLLGPGPGVLATTTPSWFSLVTSRSSGHVCGTRPAASCQRRRPRAVADRRGDGDCSLPSPSCMVDRRAARRLLAGWRVGRADASSPLPYPLARGSPPPAARPPRHRRPGRRRSAPWTSGLLGSDRRRRPRCRRARSRPAPGVDG